MAIEKLTKDMNIIASLDDEPNDVGGLTAAELKAKFDEGGNAVKDYLNEKLIPALETLGVEQAVLAPEGAGFKYLRLNSNLALEFSDDGETWRTTGSQIVDGEGNTLGYGAYVSEEDRERWNAKQPAIPGKAGQIPVFGEDGGWTGMDQVREATAALYGKGPGATVDEVLALLGVNHQHWWRATVTQDREWYGEIRKDITEKTSLQGTVQYADRIVIDQTNGAISLAEPESVTFTTSKNSPELLEKLIGKYIQIASSGVFYFVPEDATVKSSNATLVYSYDYDSNDDKYYTHHLNWSSGSVAYPFAKALRTEFYKENADTAELLKSNDRHAHPDHGYHIQSISAELGETAAVTLVKNSSATAKVTVRYSSELTATQDALAARLKDPQTMEVSPSTGEVAEGLRSKYFSIGTALDADIFFMPQDAPIPSIDKTSSTKYVKVQAAPATVKAETDGRVYQYLGIPFENAATAPKLEAGRYVGVGLCGAENPTVLQFSFAPKLVLVFIQPLNSSSSGRLLLFLAGELSDLYVKEAYFVFAASAISSSGTFAKMEHGALSFYSTGSAENQGNRLRQEYRYIAIG